MEVARACARTLSGAAAIAVVWRDADTCHYLAEDSPVPLWAGQRFPVTQSVSGWAMEHRRQVVIGDVRSDARVAQAADAASWIKSLVMTPVGDPPVAALGAYWADVRDPTPDEIAVLASLGECMAAALRAASVRAALNLKLEEVESTRAARDADSHALEFQARLLEVVEQAIIATDLDGRVIYWNPGAERLYGWAEAEARGRTVLELKAAPDDGGFAAALMEALGKGGSWSGELVLRRKDGSTFPALVSDWPVTNSDGELIGIVGVSTDNTERHKGRQHQQMLINELNHRVKNMLAVVQAIAAQSLRDELPLSRARDIFNERLHALAHAQGLMVSAGWRPVSLHSLLSLVLSPFGYGDGLSRIVLEGPDVAIGPERGVTVALTVHELATNAVKYGALSSSAGRVRLIWGKTAGEQGERFHLNWRETGGPLVSRPVRRGSGSRIIERALAAELDGRASLVFEDTGVVFVLEAPAAGLIASATEPLPIP